MTWLIAYDVASPRRWRQLYRLVKYYGMRSQWSVFVVTNPAFRPAVFLAKAAKILDPVEDDLRLYRLNGPVASSNGDQGLIPIQRGIYISGQPTARKRVPVRSAAEDSPD